MKKRIIALVMVLLMLMSSFSTVLAEDKDPKEGDQGNVITDFSEPRKVLYDSSFDLSTVDPDVLEAWYAQTVVVPDQTLAKALKNAAGVSSSSDLHVSDMLGLIGTLDISGLGISSLVGMEYAINVTKLLVSNNKLTSLDSLGNLYKLEYLDYSNNQVKSVPGWVFTAESLKYVNGNHNNSSSIERSDGDSVLEKLYLEGNSISDLSRLVKLSKIKELSFANNNITVFPEILSNFSTLNNLSLAGNQIEEVPDLSSMKGLKILDLSSNKLTEVPTGLVNIPALSHLNLSGNQIEEVPDSISGTTITILNLSQNNITKVPESLVSMPSLTILDLGVNYIDTTEETNSAVITSLSEKLDTFYYKIQIPSFNFEMHEFEDKPSGKLTWEGIGDVVSEEEGSLVITKFVLERIEETITEDDPDNTSETDESNEESQGSESGTTTSDGTRPTINIYKEIAVLDSTVREYVDDTASPGVNYTYRLTAYATCSYLGETAFEVKIEKKVNTAEMIKDTIDKSMIIKLAILGVVLLAVVAVSVVVSKNNKKKRRKKKRRRKGSTNKKKPVRTQNGRPVEKTGEKQELEKKIDRYMKEELSND